MSPSMTVAIHACMYTLHVHMGIHKDSRRQSVEASLIGLARTRKGSVLAYIGFSGC